MIIGGLVLSEEFRGQCGVIGAGLLESTSTGKSRRKTGIMACERGYLSDNEEPVIMSTEFNDAMSEARQKMDFD